MNVIVIFHVPQECGEPSLTFIRQEDGEIAEVVALPYCAGFYDDGVERVHSFRKAFSFEENVNLAGNRRPIADRFNDRYRYGMIPLDVQRKYAGVIKGNEMVYKVREVRTKEEGRMALQNGDGLDFWEGSVFVDAFVKVAERRYSSEKDDYRKEMEALGFDMKGWCVYKRTKTRIHDFMRAVCEGFHGYHVVSLHQIG